MIYLGPGCITKGHRLWNFAKNEIVGRRDVVFFEDMTYDPGSFGKPVILTNEDDTLDDDERFTVAKILRHRQAVKDFEFLVRWQGYSADHATWEPVEHLDHCPDRIRQYFRRIEGPIPRSLAIANVVTSPTQH